MFTEIRSGRGIDILEANNTRLVWEKKFLKEQLDLHLATDDSPRFPGV